MEREKERERGLFSQPRLRVSQNLEKKLQQHAYVVYPPEGPRPPSPEAVHALAKAERERDQKAAKK